MLENSIVAVSSRAKPRHGTSAGVVFEMQFDIGDISGPIVEMDEAV
jgi:hypothetical protein